MPELPLTAVERRPIPRASQAFSAVTLLVDPPVVAPPSADERMVALLRRARERGVTTFDVADARFPERAERLIATAFPNPDPELSAIVGRSVEALAREHGPRGKPSTSEDLATALEGSLAQSQRRLAPVPVSVVEWDPDPHGESVGAPGPSPTVPSLSGRPELLWAILLPPRAIALPEAGGSSHLFTSGFSLLDREVGALFGGESRLPEASLIARNPFSDGRLDGSRFAGLTSLAGPGAGPVDVRRLRAEFDPVLALGFLTKGRRRTLAQAALRFVLRWPWVATTVVPFPTPERFEEVLSYGSSPPLSDEELAELGVVK